MSDETGLSIRTLSNRWIGLGLGRVSLQLPHPHAECRSTWPTSHPIPCIFPRGLPRPGFAWGPSSSSSSCFPAGLPWPIAKFEMKVLHAREFVILSPPFARKWRFRMRASDRGHLNLHTRTVRKVGSRLCDNLLCLAAFTQPSETQYGVEREGEREEWWYQGTFPFP